MATRARTLSAAQARRGTGASEPMSRADRGARLRGQWRWSDGDWRAVEDEDLAAGRPAGPDEDEVEWDAWPVRARSGGDVPAGQSMQGVFSGESPSEEAVKLKSDVKRKRFFARHRKYRDQVDAGGSGLTVLDKVSDTPEVMQKHDKSVRELVRHLKNKG